MVAGAANVPRRQLSSAERPNPRASHSSIRRPTLITFLAIQLIANRGRAAFSRYDPRPTRPRWVMTNVLIVSALQPRHPVLLFILMKRNDPTFHRGVANTWVQ